MDDKPPPRPARSANATIQIDRLDLDEILLVDTTDQKSAMPNSVPPPLPPEEIAKAASLAPGATSVPAPAEASRTLLVVGILVGVVVVAITAGVLVGNAVRGKPAPASASTMAAAASAPATPTAATTAATITIHTVELGGAATNADP